MVSELLQKIWQHSLDLIYPPVCVHCQRVGTLLCSVCRQEIVPLSGNPSLALSQLGGYTALAYHTGAIRTAIHALKYEGLPRVGSLLGEMLADKIEKCNWQIDLLTPVPIHAERRRERGYNQADYIAQAAGTHLGIPVLSEGLQKIKATRSQVELSATERQHNVEDAFTVNPLYQNNFADRQVLIVDDVCTTGATLIACANALLAAGTATIYAATVSRARFTPDSTQAEDARVLAGAVSS